MNNLYQTSDLNLANVLATKGISLHSIDKGNIRRVVFYFEKHKNLEKTIQEFWTKSLKLEPQELFANQKLLKSMIYS